ncbi:3-oxoacyl-ACP reductase [Comamonas serinivorans]|uniref:3-oxoacyl-ACP reductase n=1 Tax=Comamonas serinivorans TaxID=1082851 RepID=A0A1Y0EN12_9BURK|nr:3-oxoacyl-ACP reductase FabG [Comamonas serinivorans]ARU04987.1 3-oxoacyl-ACP reductase [Comamonas serinivorans]
MPTETATEATTGRGDAQRVRWALVTGASGDIGAAVATTLAAQGLAVWVHANRNAARADAVVASIEAAGGQARPIVFDVADGAACAAAVAQMLAVAPIQVLVNNAGVHDDAVMPGMRAEQWQRVIDVNLNGFFNVTQPLLLPMLRTRWGRIVNVTSVAGQAGNRGQVNYAAAKGGLHAATKALALEVASRGVTVNAVAPGIIATAMSADTFDAARIKQLVPVQRAGQAQEVADLVAFLASERAGYITAQTLAINGGMWAA